MRVPSFHCCAFFGNGSSPHTLLFACHPRSRISPRGKTVRTGCHCCVFFGNGSSPHTLLFSCHPRSYISPRDKTVRTGRYHELAAMRVPSFHCCVFFWQREQSAHSSFCMSSSLTHFPTGQNCSHGVSLLCFFWQREQSAHSSFFMSSSLLHFPAGQNCSHGSLSRACSNEGAIFPLLCFFGNGSSPHTLLFACHPRSR